MKTVNIKGRPYIMVNERIQEFRKIYPDYSLETEIISMTGDSVCLKAIIKNEEGRVLATGLAHEDRGASMINKTSYVENAETSAWGRALGNLGVGIDASIASAEEVLNAMAGQIAKQTPHSEEGNDTYYEAVSKDLVKNSGSMEDLLSAWGRNTPQISYLKKNSPELYEALEVLKEQLKANIHE